MSFTQEHAVAGGSLGPLTELGNGAQAIVYGVEFRLPGTPWPLAYKRFKAACLDEIDADVLQQLIAWQEQPAGKGLQALAAWPLRLVVDQGRVSGFLMRKAPAEFTVELALTRGRHQWRLLEVQHLLNPTHLLADRNVLIHDRWRLEFLQDVAEALLLMHGLGVAVGDLSPKNLLARIHGRPRCFFLDCDAVSLHGRSVLPQFETPDWQAPDVVKATVATDTYKFAMLAGRLFAGDQSSVDPSALRRVGADLHDLGRRGLGPAGDRPHLADWVPALEAALVGASLELPAGQPRLRRAGAQLGSTPAWSPAAAATGSAAGMATPMRRAAHWLVAAGTAAVAVIAVLAANHAGLGSSPASSGGLAARTATSSGDVRDVTTASGGRTSGTVTKGVVSLDKAAAAGTSSPVAAATLDVFDKYFSNINAKHFRSAYEALSARRQAQEPYPHFRSGFAGTRDERVVISSVRGPAAVGDGPVVAEVSFRSHQRTAGRPCTDWHLTYTLVADDGDARLLIDKAQASSGAPQGFSC